MQNPQYKRVLLKLSGEALAGDTGFGINNTVLDDVAANITAMAALGVQVGIVVGGGNFWRGRTSGNMDRITADHMGMLATTINALALQDALERAGTPVRVQSAVEMRQFAEPYIRRRAMRHLEKGRIVIFASGTGNPYFSTDTAAALRAAEIEADALMMARNVDAVYTADPKVDAAAKKIDTITYMQILNMGLTVMDSTALALCKDNGIPILAFGLQPPRNMVDAVCGSNIGTLICDNPNVG